MSIFDNGDRERATYSNLAKVLKISIPDHTLLYEVPAYLMSFLIERIEKLEKEVSELKKEKN